MKRNIRLFIVGGVVIIIAVLLVFRYLSVPSLVRTTAFFPSPSFPIYSTMVSLDSPESVIATTKCGYYDERCAGARNNCQLTKTWNNCPTTSDGRGGPNATGTACTSVSVFPELQVGCYIDNIGECTYKNRVSPLYHYCQRLTVQ